MAQQKQDAGSQTFWQIDTNTGQVVPTSGTGSGPPPAIGGPSPGERDNPGTESYPNQPGGTTTTTTTGGDGAGTTFDWRAYLTNWGFPPDVVNELDSIFRRYNDPSQAQAAALAYIRGTDWYKTTFAGIQDGIKNGVIGDESDYRAYVNQLNQYYQRYQGRNVTTSEVAQYLQQGWSTGQVDQHFQGQAYIAANKNDIQYQLGAFDSQGRATDAQLNALGDQAGGLDNALGPAVQKRIALAQQKLQRIFQGQLATPALSILNNGRLATTNTAGKTQDYAA